MSEGFPPEYRLVLERYYRRLAEEKAATSGGDGAQAKPKPRPRRLRSRESPGEAIARR